MTLTPFFGVGMGSILSPDSEMRAGRSFPVSLVVLAMMVTPGCFNGDAPFDPNAAPSMPPLNATIFMDPDIITADDPTAFVGLTANGQGQRSMFDRRVNGFVTVDAYLFDAAFSDGLTAEVQVNPEFTAVDALAAAQKYAAALGRSPAILRSEIQSVGIHRGEEAFVGGSNTLVIHSQQADLYEAAGILEEAIAHEAVHASLDAMHAASAGWLAAQASDPAFISGVARDLPTLEDLAESFIPYIALRYRSDRITTFLANVVSSTIPGRVAYFDTQGFNMNPLQQ
jgi:hypothetical protein